MGFTKFKERQPERFAKPSKAELVKKLKEIAEKERDKMGNEQLTEHQKSVYEFLKQQVDNLAEENRKNDARPRIDQFFSARLER